MTAQAYPPPPDLAEERAPYTILDIKKIETIKRRTARFVMKDFSRESSFTDMLNTLEWDTLEERKKKARMTVLYKIQNQLRGINKNKYLIKTTEIRTRSSEQTKFTRGTVTKNVCKYSYLPRTISDWNQLYHASTTAPTIKGFKSTL